MGRQLRQMSESGRASEVLDQSSSDICSTSDDDEDFTKFKSPQGKGTFSPSSPQSGDKEEPKKVSTEGFGSQGFGSNSSASEKESSKGGQKSKKADHGYDETKLSLSGIEALIEKVVTPNEPCQLINAPAYKNLVLEMTPDMDPFNNDEKYVEKFTMFTLKAIKVYCKSERAKEVLAGFKLLELLAAQLNKPFFAQLCCTRWADRIFEIWERTREPIHKLTISQLLSDWIHIFDGRVNVMPFRVIAQKLPLPSATQDAKTRRKTWENKGVASPAVNRTEEPDSPITPKSPKPPKTAKVIVSPKHSKKKKQEEEEEMPAAPEASPAAGSDLDCKLREYFCRYDLDGSDTVNNNDEMQQLVTNAIFKLKLMVAPDAVEKRIADAGNMDELNWKFDDFQSWFKEAFAKEIRKAKIK